MPGAPVLGVPEGAYLERAGEAARDAFERRAAELAAAGLDVRRVPLFPDFADDVRELTAVNRYEAARSHAEWFPRYGSLYREQSAATVREGQAVTAERYRLALRARTAFRTALERATEAAGVDVWISPAATGPAPYGLHHTGDPVMALPWSWSGWPALALPLPPVTANALPLALQCTTRAGHDEELLAWAPLLTAT